MTCCGRSVPSWSRCPRHGAKTFCCGAGGGQLFIADDSVELPGGQREPQAVRGSVRHRGRRRSR